MTNDNTTRSTDATARHDRARVLAAAATLALPFVLVLASWPLLEDRLPPELASHWSGAGTADGAMPAGQLLLLSLLLTGLPAVVSVVLAFVPTVSAQSRRFAFLLAGVFAGMGAATWFTSALLTMQTGDPFEVVLGGWFLLQMIAAGYGVIPLLIAPKPAVIATDHAKRIEFEPGQTAAWSRTITSALFAWVALALVVMGAAIYGADIVQGRISEVIFGVVVMAIAIVLVASFARIRVAADWRGLRVYSSVLRLPLKRIRLDQIEAVEVAELVPTEWGGWGYRIMPGRSALIVKGGPGLIVTTTNQKQFAITLPDPETPAALLATLRDDTHAARHERSARSDSTNQIEKKS